jgi:hypothetical protein
MARLCAMEVTGVTWTPSVVLPAAMVGMTAVIMSLGAMSSASVIGNALRLRGTDTRQA